MRLSWGQIQQVNQESCGSPRCATIFVLCQESRVTVTHRSHLGGCAWVLFFYLASFSLSLFSFLTPPFSPFSPASWPSLHHPYAHSLPLPFILSLLQLDKEDTLTLSHARTNNPHKQLNKPFKKTHHNLHGITSRQTNRQRENQTPTTKGNPLQCRLTCIICSRTRMPAIYTNLLLLFACS